MGHQHESYQSRHLPSVEEAGHTAEKIEGDLLVMVAPYTVRKVLQPHSPCVKLLEILMRKLTI